MWVRPFFSWSINVTDSELCKPKSNAGRKYAKVNLMETYSLWWNSYIKQCKLVSRAEHVERSTRNARNLIVK